MTGSGTPGAAVNIANPTRDFRLPVISLAEHLCFQGEHLLFFKEDISMHHHLKNLKRCFILTVSAARQQRK
jgi:hypothetical protein